MQGLPSSSQRSYELPDLAERAEYVRRNFDAIARSYDRFNDLTTFGLHRLWKRRTVALCRLQPGMRALDLCAGSGDLSLLLARQLGRRGQVSALDFSAGMLAVLEARLASLPPAAAPVLVQQGDASDLSRFADGTFDAVTIGFGLRNILERERCLRECRRVLRPGGRLIILDVGKTPRGPIGFLHGFYFEKIVPRVGHLLEGKRTEMYEYLPASAQVYLSQSQLSELLQRVGFVEVRFWNQLFGAAVIHGATVPGPS
ncbi:MAG: ubiquinone/menaquinone biosynthesis methyltransferase [Leptospirales bacterium]|nr:ubiquinone/menaquinone biosynthesis methyltransferase [Leptospirales bacterium]